jgi:hypothetical protein
MLEAPVYKYKQGLWAGFFSRFEWMKILRSLYQEAWTKNENINVRVMCSHPHPAKRIFYFSSFYFAKFSLSLKNFSLSHLSLSLMNHTQVPRPTWHLFSFLTV